MTYDGRPWGYDFNRCYIFYKERDQIAVDGSKTNLAQLDCGTEETIRNQVIFPAIKGFSDLTDSGKSILTKLSNENWQKSATFPDRDYPTLIRALTLKETLSFSFWNDFSKFKYTSFVETGNWHLDFLSD